jgi:hypothetical protein
VWLTRDFGGECSLEAGDGDVVRRQAVESAVLGQLDYTMIAINPCLASYVRINYS